MSVIVPPGLRGVVFDVGETLVDETRQWQRQAELAGVTAFTAMAVLGALIDRDEDHRRLWPILGVKGPEAGGQLVQADLYPDALGCLRTVGGRGLVVGIAGNQPAGVEMQLRSMGFEADFIASSASWGVAKPSPEFFARITREADLHVGEILYVGDRLDNDVLPARKAGMRTAFIRRGPWGHIHAERPEVRHADMRIDSLAELADALVNAPEA